MITLDSETEAHQHGDWGGLAVQPAINGDTNFALTDLLLTLFTRCRI